MGHVFMDREDGESVWERKQDAKSDFTHLITLFKALLSIHLTGGLCRFLALLQTVL